MPLQLTLVLVTHARTAVHAKVTHWATRVIVLLDTLVLIVDLVRLLYHYLLSHLEQYPPH